MKVFLILLLTMTMAIASFNCQITGVQDKLKTDIKLTVNDILSNPTYKAISYGGYRQTSRDHQPSIEELKEDMKILHAMGIRILRT